MHVCVRVCVMVGWEQGAGAPQPEDPALRVTDSQEGTLRAPADISRNTHTHTPQVAVPSDRPHQSCHAN